MKSTIVALSIATLTATGFAGPSNAMPVYAPLEIGTTLSAEKVHHRSAPSSRRYDRRILPPYKIIRKLHRKGYSHITRVRLKNSKRYVVRAVGRRGPVKLIVNARNGKVLKRTRLARHGHYYNNGYSFGGSRGGWSWSYTFR